jgi:hypothetical protein
MLVVVICVWWWRRHNGGSGVDNHSMRDVIDMVLLSDSGVEW